MSRLSLLSADAARKLQEQMRAQDVARDNSRLPQEFADPPAQDLFPEWVHVTSETQDANGRQDGYTETYDPDTDTWTDALPCKVMTPDGSVISAGTSGQSLHFPARVWGFDTDHTTPVYMTSASLTVRRADGTQAVAGVNVIEFGYTGLWNIHQQAPGVARVHPVGFSGNIDVLQSFDPGNCAAPACTLTFGDGILTKVTCQSGTTIKSSGMPSFSSLPPGPVSANGSGGTGCFFTGTGILLPDDTQQSIETLQPGDRVRSFDHAGNWTISEVACVHERQTRALYVVRGGGASVYVTGDHPFAVTPMLFMPLEHCSRVLARFGGSPPGIIDVEVERKPAPGWFTVWNLHLRMGPPTYVANGFLVHNKEGGG